MKYTRPVDMWGSNIPPLKCGQWVSCGGRPLSRYVGTDAAGVVWLAHGGSDVEVNQKFSKMRAAFKVAQ